jgi:hypothetical protein
MQANATNVLVGVVLIFVLLFFIFNSGTFVAPPQREIVVVQPRPPLYPHSGYRRPFRRRPFRRRQRW